MNVVAFNAPAKLAADFPQKLRDLADLIEAGKITKFTAAYVLDDEYNFLRPGSPADNLILANLLHFRAQHTFLAG